MTFIFEKCYQRVIFMIYSSHNIILEGMTSVSAIINAARQNKLRRSVHCIYFDKNKIRKEHGRYLFLKNATSELGIDFKIVSSDEIEALSTGKTHGGILAEVSNAVYKDLTEDDILSQGFAAIIEGVEDPYSLGYSLRTLYACGCDTVILPRHLPVASDSTLCKASAGASELLNIIMGDVVEIALKYKSKGYKVACAAIPDSLPCFESNLSLPLLLVIGGEKRGISSSLLSIKDLNVRIPYGREFLGSLSTASAVSILAYEVLRQNQYR